MTQNGRAWRVVSVCLLGSPAATAKANEHRLALLDTIITQVTERGWTRLDALLLPGGFLRTQAALTRASRAERRSRLLAEPWWGPLKAAAVALAQGEGASPRLVCGLLGPERRVNEVAEQTAIAVDRRGLAGLAPKLFPAPSEAEDEHHLAPAVADYGDERRYLAWGDAAPGNRAVLAVGSDLFALARDPAVPAFVPTLRHLWDGQQVRAVGARGFRGLKRDALAAWRTLLVRQAPSLALACVHGFAAPGRDGYWQRHGLALASATLGGGLVVAAAHFERRLPELTTSPLASAGVGPEHRAAGPQRRSQRLLPEAGFVVPAGATQPAALVRLYAAGGAA